MASKLMTIDQLCNLLRDAGTKGVDAYEKKLRDNENDPLRLEDLACEGYVALAFAKYGWSITIRKTSPDLEGRLNGIFLGIEVKHFRYKPSHDPVEDAALASSEAEFVLTPSLKATEGNEESWDQMFRFAKDHAYQYIDGEFNVMFFWSHTQAHHFGTILTAAHMYDEELEMSSCDAAMKNLSAMMMNAVWGHHGSIILEVIAHAKKPLTRELWELLDQIREPYNDFRDAR